MTIHRLLRDVSFGPDEIAVMVAAYEDALRELGLTNRTDPATEIVARKIIELAQGGELDQARLGEQAVRSLTV